MQYPLLSWQSLVIYNSLKWPMSFAQYHTNFASSVSLIDFKRKNLFSFVWWFDSIKKYFPKIWPSDAQNRDKYISHFIHCASICFIFKAKNEFISLFKFDNRNLYKKILCSNIYEQYVILTFFHDIDRFNVKTDLMRTLANPWFEEKNLLHEDCTYGFARERIPTSAI